MFLMVICKTFKSEYGAHCLCSACAHVDHTLYVSYEIDEDHFQAKIKGLGGIGYEP